MGFLFHGKLCGYGFEIKSQTLDFFNLGDQPVQILNSDIAKPFLWIGLSGD